MRTQWFRKLVPAWVGSWGIGVLLCAGCSAGGLEEPAYRTWLQNPENGLTQELVAGSATATCSYRPTDLLVTQELRTSSLEPSPAVLDSLRPTYAGKAYFTLSLAQGGAEIENQLVNDQAAYAQALAYLNTHIAQDVFLVTSAHDSVAALAAAYPRQYGNTGRTTILLVFAANERTLHHDFRISFHDRHFGLGTLRFPFRGSALQALPALKF